MCTHVAIIPHIQAFGTFFIAWDLKSLAAEADPENFSGVLDLMPYHECIRMHGPRLGLFQRVAFATTEGIAYNVNKFNGDSGGPRGAVLLTGLPNPHATKVGLMKIITSTTDTSALLWLGQNCGAGDDVSGCGCQIVCVCAGHAREEYIYVKTCMQGCMWRG